MNFQLTDEQLLLKDAVTSYIAANFGLEHRPSLATPGGIASSWQQLARELGILAAPFPEEFGGIGGGMIENMIIMEAIGQAIAPVPYLSTVVIAGRLLLEGGGPQAAQAIGDIIDGGMIIAFAHAEKQARDCRSDIATCITEDAGEVRLNGEKSVVNGAPGATHLLISARTGGAQRDRDGVSLYLVERDRPGISLRSFDLIDGSRAADIRFADVALTDQDLIGVRDGAMPLIDRASDAAIVALCAEAVGCMRAMLLLTTEHARQRKQFGTPLAGFQILQHRMVDMWIKLEHATSFAHAAAAAVEDPARATWMASAAKAYIGKAGDFVGRYAVQIHGGSGMMDETPVAHFFKRMMVIQRQLGSTDHHLTRFARYAGVTVPPDRILANGEAGVEPENAVIDDILDSASDAAFRVKIRQFIDQNLVGELRRLAHQEGGSFGRPIVTNPWQQLLHERGWVAPSWPEEFGGPGWTARQRYIFEAEMAAAGAPRLPAMGLQMVGPVIMKFGTPEQKAFYLPRILSGEHYWCQGYSEPNAGSDLVAVQLRAVREGDDYVLNGTKLWTTFAQFANWIFLLVRTSTEGKPQAGITFLVAPMDTPGITVRPLISASGDHEVNQVFFDDVRVPVVNRIGDENTGWTVAKYLLEFERGVGHQVPSLFVELAKLRTIAQCEPGDDGASLWDQDDFKRLFAELEIEALAASLTEQRLVYSLPTGQSVGDATASLMKLSWSKTAQRIDHLALDAIGRYAAVDQRHALIDKPTTQGVGPAYALMPTNRYLNDRAMTIAGGSSEVQHNILARMVVKM